MTRYRNTVWPGERGEAETRGEGQVPAGSAAQPGGFAWEGPLPGAALRCTMSRPRACTQTPTGPGLLLGGTSALSPEVTPLCDPGPRLRVPVCRQ